MESEHFIGKVAQKAIIEHDGKILITRGKGDVDLWELPGGRLHRDEKPEEGLAREVKEELGVDVVIGRIMYAEQFTMRNPAEPPHFFIGYTATLADPLQEFVFDPVEVTEARWITKDELTTHKIYGNCLRALEAYFGVR